MLRLDSPGAQASQQNLEFSPESMVGKLLLQSKYTQAGRWIFLLLDGVQLSSQGLPTCQLCSVSNDTPSLPSTVCNEGALSPRSLASWRTSCQKLWWHLSRAWVMGGTLQDTPDRLGNPARKPLCTESDAPVAHTVSSETARAKLHCHCTLSMCCS